MSHTFRRARTDELDSLETFLLEEGTTEWNYLPKDGVSAQFVSLRECPEQNIIVVAVIPNENEEIVVGLGIYSRTTPARFLQYLSPTTDHNNTVYIAEMCVHRAYIGKGIGASLLSHIVNIAKEQGTEECVIYRHEENLGSAGMMRKVGFVEVATFPEPHHTAGSGKITVLTIKPT
jgi:ribosomal protein S18 acetylase RimI-like enzyme